LFSQWETGAESLGILRFCHLTNQETESSLRELVSGADLLTQSQGEIVLGLIETYRALGGGW
jgi:hypothetical protein